MQAIPRNHRRSVDPGWRPRFRRAVTCAIRPKRPPAGATRVLRLSLEKWRARGRPRRPGFAAPGAAPGRAPASWRPKVPSQAYGGAGAVASPAVQQPLAGADSHGLNLQPVRRRSGACRLLRHAGGSGGTSAFYRRPVRGFRAGWFKNIRIDPSGWRVAASARIEKAWRQPGPCPRAVRARRRIPAWAPAITTVVSGRGCRASGETFGDSAYLGILAPQGALACADPSGLRAKGANSFVPA